MEDYKDKKEKKGNKKKEFYRSLFFVLAMCTFAFILRLIIAFSFSINYDDKKGNLVVFLVSYAITFGVFIPLYFLLCKNKTNKEKSKE